MASAFVVEIRKRDGRWSVACDGEPMFAFMRRERALRLADLLARRKYQETGTASVVRLVEGGDAVDVILHGEDDPAARALASVRYASMLRASRTREVAPAPELRRRA